MLAVELELRVLAAVGKMPPPGFADVLMKLRDIGLVDDEREIRWIGWSLSS
jgi:hypothetical protein